uniref:Uncharacterized protein n=1 Tax=Plectus sambesii TaxID=2011161 RepID=A0A914VMF4_9BILA
MSKSTLHVSSDNDQRSSQLLQPHRRSVRRSSRHRRRRSQLPAEFISARLAPSSSSAALGRSGWRTEGGRRSLLAHQRPCNRPINSLVSALVILARRRFVSEQGLVSAAALTDEEPAGLNRSVEPCEQRGQAERGRRFPHRYPFDSNGVAESSFTYRPAALFSNRANADGITGRRSCNHG